MKRHDWTHADIAAMTEGLSGPALITKAEAATLWTRGDLGRVSGISASRLAALARGARPTKAERAAINWALAVRIL